MNMKTWILRTKQEEYPDSKKRFPFVQACAILNSRTNIFEMSKSRLITTKLMQKLQLRVGAQATDMVSKLLALLDTKSLTWELRKLKKSQLMTTGL